MKSTSPDQSDPQPTGDEVFDASRGGGENPNAGAAAGAAGAEQERITRLQAFATDAYDRLGDSANQLTEQAQEIYNSGEAYVRSHPGPSVGGAFLVGLLIGLLAGRE